jgi:hypothetical protein
MTISSQVRETTECPRCLTDHATAQPGFSCTVHGHAFVYVCTQDGEDRDECPEDGCTEGMWTS